MAVVNITRMVEYVVERAEIAVVVILALFLASCGQEVHCKPPEGIFNPVGMTVIDGKALVANSNYLYKRCSASIAVIGKGQTKNITLDGDIPGGIWRISKDIVITLRGKRKVEVFSFDGELLRENEIGGDPIAVTSDGERIAVATFWGDIILLSSLLEEEKRFKVGGHPSAISMDAGQIAVGISNAPEVYLVGVTWTNLGGDSIKDVALKDGFVYVLSASGANTVLYTLGVECNLCVKDYKEFKGEPVALSLIGDNVFVAYSRDKKTIVWSNGVTKTWGDIALDMEVSREAIYVLMETDVLKKWRKSAGVMLY